MLAALPWSPLFQQLLDGIGWVLAKLYDTIPNFGISIIILTILIRLVLLPLGIKQIKSMQAMQAIQPKVKELQKRFKADKQKAQEETMKLYRDHGVSPLGGCLPLLLQFPLLVAMYAVVRPPQLIAVGESGRPVVSVSKSQPLSDYQAGIVSYEIHNNHLPVGSPLFENVIRHQDLGFAWLNLQCSTSQAGTNAEIIDSNREAVVAGKPILDKTGNRLPIDVLSQATENCGVSPTSKIPYFVFLALMIATTFYQQRQMQRASPPDAASQQQQALLKVMPLMFGVFGYAFPSGLVVYWTTANLWQIGQQFVLLKAGHIGPDALERRKQEMANRAPSQKKGFLGRLMARAEEERQRRGEDGTTMRKPGSGKPKPPGGRPGPSGKKKKPGGSSGSSNGKGRPKR